jgi:hypothetical protein
MPNIAWKSRWNHQKYRQTFIAIIITAIVLLAAMPQGFDYIQSRGGLKWNDFLLEILPSINLSIPIFVAMYSLAILFLFRIFKNPHLMTLFVAAYIVVTITRFVLIYFIPLDPPKGMIDLVDPITNIFYGGKIINRDLFFSGHTSSMFLIYLILDRKIDKLIALAITIFIAISLLLQHIHYTADVLAAFPISWIIWKFCSKKLSFFV